MVSVLIIGFWLLAGAAIVLGVCLVKNQNQLPQSCRDLVLYGKIRGKRTKWSMIQLIEVPKRWFIYFYLLGVVINGVATVIVTHCYLKNSPLPEWLGLLLRACVANTEMSSCGALSVILLIGMMFVQNLRRFMECLLVSIYSNSTMNLLHFTLGVILYSTFFLAVLSEAPPTTSTDEDLLRFKWNHAVGIALFLWASWHHNRTHVSLAELRRNKKGEVANYEHAIPRGAWFEYISCPHFFMEILIYLSFVIVAGLHHKAVLSIAVFVLANQTMAGYMTHCWYRENFKSYPPQRKAIFPFVF